MAPNQQNAYNPAPTRTTMPYNITPYSPQPNNTMQSSLVSTQQDFAEALKQATMQAEPDHDLINWLAQQRDMKIQSDPSKYEGVTPTQDLISRQMALNPINSITPPAPAPSVSPDQAGQQLANMLRVVSQPTAPVNVQGQTPTGLSPTGIVRPTATPAPAPTAPSSMPSTMAGQIDYLTQKSMAGLDEKMPEMSAMTYEQATQQAGKEVNPQFEQMIKELVKGTDIDLEKRGLFNSPLASGIVAERTGQVKATQAQQVAQRASQLVQQSEEKVFREKQLYLQEKQMRTQAINDLLAQLSNRELSEAQITGIYRNVKTLQMQQFEADKEYKQASLALQAEQIAAQREAAAAQLKLSEAQLTGTYNGQQTLAARQLEYQQKQDAIASALQRVQVYGEVRTQADADLLGVPIGTGSFQAIQAGKELAQQAQIASQNLALQEGSLTGTYKGQDTLEAQKFKADEAYRDIQTKMAEAGLTGKYNGEETLEQKKFNLDQMTTAVNQAIARVQTIGYVASQEDAALLGVPVNTKTADALQAARALEQQKEIAMAQIASDEQMAANSLSASTSQNSFSKDMAIWQSTGKAPDSQVLRGYGIEPGTPYTGDFAEQLTKIQLDETQQGIADKQQLEEAGAQAMSEYGFPNQETGVVFAKFKEYGSKEIAMQMLEQNRDELASEGVDVGALERAFSQLWPNSTGTQSGLEKLLGFLLPGSEVNEILGK